MSFELVKQIKIKYNILCQDIRCLQFSNISLSFDFVMEAKKFMFVLLFVLQVFLFKNCESSQLMMPLAINGILQEYFQKESPNIDVLHFGSPTGPGERLIMELLRLQNSSISINISQIGVKPFGKDKLNVSSILIFDSPEIFL